MFSRDLSKVFKLTAIIGLHNLLFCDISFGCPLYRVVVRNRFPFHYEKEKSGTMRCKQFRALCSSTLTCKRLHNTRQHRRFVEKTLSLL